MLHCIMWCIWREPNVRSFERCEHSILEIKSFFFYTLLEWSLALPTFACFSISESLDHCILGH